MIPTAQWLMASSLCYTGGCQLVNTELSIHSKITCFDQIIIPLLLQIVVVGGGGMPIYIALSFCLSTTFMSSLKHLKFKVEIHQILLAH